MADPPGKDWSALQKLAVVCERALGVSARVWFQRYNGRAREDLPRIRHADERDLESLRLAPLIQAEGSFPSLQERATRRMAYQDAKRQKNLEDILDQAVHGLAHGPPVSTAPVAEDWSARFFGIVQDVSYPPMKKIWGGVLASEVRRPGSFSLRTLEAVRSMTPLEADALGKIAPLLVNGQAVLRGPDAGSLLQVREFHALVDAGVMSGTALAWEIVPEARIVLADLLVQLKGREPMIMEAWRLTGVGIELMPLIHAKAHRSFVRWLLEEATARDFRWTLHRMVTRDPPAWDSRPAKLHEI